MSPRVMFSWVWTQVFAVKLLLKHTSVALIKSMIDIVNYIVAKCSQAHVNTPEVGHHAQYFLVERHMHTKIETMKASTLLDTYS